MRQNAGCWYSSDGAHCLPASLFSAPVDSRFRSARTPTKQKACPCLRGRRWSESPESLSVSLTEAAGSAQLPSLLANVGRREGSFGSGIARRAAALQGTTATHQAKIEKDAERRTHSHPCQAEKTIRARTDARQVETHPEVLRHRMRLVVLEKHFGSP